MTGSLLAQGPRSDHEIFLYDAYLHDRVQRGPGKQRLRVFLGQSYTAMGTKVIDTQVLQQRNWTHCMAHVYRLAVSREEHGVIHLRFIFLAKVLAVLLKDCELSSVCRVILVAGSAVEFEDFLTAVVSK